MPTTALELKAALIPALSGYIGTYTFSSGLIAPALRIDDGSDPFPEEPNIEGLEVVITPQIEVPIRQLIGGYQETFTTLIVLKQWDIEQTVMNARSAVLQAIAQFDSLEVGQLRRVMRSSKLDNIETLTIPVSESVWQPDADFFE